MSVGRAHMAAHRRYVSSPERAANSPFAVWVRKAKIARELEQRAGERLHGTARAVAQLRRMLGEERRVDYVPPAAGRRARPATAGAGGRRSQRSVRPASASACRVLEDGADVAALGGARAEYCPPSTRQWHCQHGEQQQQQQQQHHHHHHHHQHQEEQQHRQLRRRRPQTAGAAAKGARPQLRARPRSATPIGQRGIAASNGADDGSCGSGGIDRRFVTQRPASAPRLRRAPPTPQSKFGWHALAQNHSTPTVGGVTAGTVHIHPRPPSARRKRGVPSGCKWGGSGKGPRGRSDGTARSMQQLHGRARRDGAISGSGSSSGSGGGPGGTRQPPAVSGSRARVHAAQTRYGELKAARQAAFSGSVVVVAAVTAHSDSGATPCEQGGQSSCGAYAESDGSSGGGGGVDSGGGGGGGGGSTHGMGVLVPHSSAKRCPVEIELDLPPGPPKPRPTVQRVPSPASIAAVSPDRLFRTVYTREYATELSRVGSPSNFGVRRSAPPVNSVRGQSQRAQVPVAVRVGRAAARRSPSPTYMGGGFHANVPQQQQQQRHQQDEYPQVSEDPNAEKSNVTQLTVRITNPLVPRFTTAETELAQW